MDRQVGVLKTDRYGIAVSGLLIRQLVMPNNIAGSDKILTFIAEEISKDSYVNIMAQYHPCFEAVHDQQINRRINSDEYYRAVDIANKVGLSRGF